MPEGFGPLQQSVLRLGGQNFLPRSELESSWGWSLPELDLQYCRFCNLLLEGGEQPLSGSVGERAGSGSSPWAESSFDFPAQV